MCRTSSSDYVSWHSIKPKLYEGVDTNAGLMTYKRGNDEDTPYHANPIPTPMFSSHPP